MRKEEFMKELEYLLQDVPEEEKEDAIAYYRDYLDEAGEEQEETVIREFGSPERIAAIIRADLNGNLDEGGSFTETGYEDERFRDPNYQIVSRYDLPEEREEDKKGPEVSGRQENRTQQEQRAKKGRWEWWKIAGAVLLACFLLPVIIPLTFGIGGGLIGLVFGVGGGAFGIFALFVGVLICLTIALGAVTFSLLLAGILLLIFGIAHLAAPLQGVLYIGTGVGILGLGFLCLSLCGMYYGRFLPWLFSSAVNLIGKLFHRKGACA